MAGFLDALKSLTVPQNEVQPIHQSQGIAIEPSTISGRIQEWLGAREPMQGGTVQDILSSRFQPNSNDAFQSMLSAAKVAQGGDYHTAGEFADERMKSAMEQLSLLKKASSGGGSVPAAIQVADAIDEARKTGNSQRLNDILQAAKITRLDPGMLLNNEGIVNELPGYGQTAGSIEYLKKLSGQQGQKDVDLQMNPLIAGGEAAARLQQENDFARQIAAEKKLGEQYPDAASGANIMDNVTANMENIYSALEKSKSIVSTQNTPLENLSASVRGSAPGQYIGKKIGTEEQSYRNQLTMMRPALINAIRQTTGMSAKSMDSNTELQFYLNMATNPDADIQANRAALKYLKDTYGVGGAIMQKFGGQNPGLNLPGANTPTDTVIDWNDLQ